MHCLTDSQVADWLDQRSIPSDPYHGVVAPRDYLRFYPPAQNSQLDEFVRCYYERVIGGSDSLVHIIDWALYTQDEMEVIMGIRSDRNEERLLIEAPGHILPPSDKEMGISLFSCSAAFGWSAYLYSSTNHSILYNWEGDIFDFWTESKAALAEMRLILKEFNLTETGS